MTQAVGIRRMAIDDGAAVAALSGELGYGSDAAVIAERIARILGDAEHAAFVAIHEGAISGWIHVHLTHLVESPSFAEIGGLVVSAGARRSGLGSALVGAVTEWARQAGVAQIRVRSNVVREDAHAFYRAAGFADLKQQITFARQLED